MKKQRKMTHKQKVAWSKTIQKQITKFKVERGDNTPVNFQYIHNEGKRT